MKVSIRVFTYNYNLITRRKEMGYTQIDFAEQAGVSMTAYSAIEKLQNPHPVVNRWKKRKALSMTRAKLNKIAKFAECDFDYLFPPEYIIALEKELLPEKGFKMVWAMETSLEQLETASNNLLVSNIDPAKIFEDKQLTEFAHEALSKLPPREAKILALRYGIFSGEKMTYAAVAREMGVTRERIRQIEAQGLSRLRHPRNMPLREFVR